jgi:hypothetical protein
MHYNLERTVSFSEESEYKSLYSWFLQEISETGEKIGAPQIPWFWNLYFTATELAYRRSLNLRTDKGDAEGEDPPLTETESIHAKLRPGSADESSDEATKFSMFGTARIIDSFNLHISKLGSGDGARCTVWGCPSYTAEVDFRNETTKDTIEIYLQVRPETFDEYVEIVRGSAPSTLTIRLQGVSGFYSDWSPSISTDGVKVLANLEDQKIIMPEGCAISPPVLGQVWETNLSLIVAGEVTGRLAHAASISEYRLDDLENAQKTEGAIEEGSRALTLSLVLQRVQRISRALAVIQIALCAIALLMFLTWLER